METSHFPSIPNPLYFHKMKELELLQERLRDLLKQYIAMKSDMERLRKTNEKHLATIAQQQHAIENVQKELQAKAVVLSASSIIDHKEDLKQHLDQVIREIEKNIESL
jgi:uncharacterized membrane protein (DUF106 family)